MDNGGRSPPTGQGTMGSDQFRRLHSCSKYVREVAAIGVGWWGVGRGFLGDGTPPLHPPAAGQSPADQYCALKLLPTSSGGGSFELWHFPISIL